MIRIGAFIDTINGTVSISLQEKISSLLRGISEIVFLEIEEDLLSQEGIQRMSKRLEKADIDRVLIIGRSPKVYEISFLKWAFPTPLNPYLFTPVNIQSLLTIPEEDKVFEETRKAILKGIFKASSSKPIETQSLSLKPEVLVIGGGIAGISVALKLAQAKIHVHLLEKEKSLGGKASGLKIFYNRPEEVQKYVEKKISEISKNPYIHPITEGEVTRLNGHLGRFQAKIRTREGSESILSPAVIVVAVGCELERKDDYFVDKRVITFTEMERRLAEEKGDFLHWCGDKVQRVTYILDRVNEDIKIDSINAIKQAYLLQSKFQCRVAILCKHVKVSSDGMERLYRRAREEGVLFFKYDEPPKISQINGQIQIEVREALPLQQGGQRSISLPSDLVIISEAFIPNLTTEALSKILKLHLGNGGFLMEDNPQLLRIRSNRRGIFVVGACRFPQDIYETLIEAEAVAQEVTALLEKGVYTYDLSVAEVDPKKCALCYTCPRVCPHSAIQIENYAERNVYFKEGKGTSFQWGAAKVDPASCFGCGICVSECPAKAITLHHEPDGLIYAQMGYPPK